jgi:ligand-binding sensor domain-containing protein/signal transduction histidine kinase
LCVLSAVRHCAVRQIFFSLEPDCFMRLLTILLLLLVLRHTSSAQEPSLYFDKITTQNGLSHNKVNCIMQDRRGFIWLGTDDGLNRFDGKNFLKFRSRPNDSTTLSGNIITGILEDREGIIWIATADGGLSRYDYRLPPRQQFRQYRHQPQNASSIPVNIINGLLEDGYGYLWLATSGSSAIRFDKKSGKFDLPVKGGIRTAMALAMDRNGSVWAGRQGGGILKIDPRNLAYEEDNRYKDLYAKLPHAAVTALFTDAQKNTWVGSWDKVLYRYGRDGKAEVFRNSGSPSSFPNDEILSFAEDAAGRIWMGGSGKGLHIFDKRTSRFYNYSYDPSQEGSLPDNRVNCIFIDKEGQVWIGTNKGVCINNPAKQQFVQTFLGKKSTTEPVTIYDFYEDGQGRIWIGTSEGIYIRETNGALTHKPLAYRGRKLHATCFYRDVDGSFYLGTNFSLFKYDASANGLSLLPNTEKDGVMRTLIESRIVSITRDTIEGNPVLLVSPYGHFISYYDLARKQWVSRLDSSRNIIQKFNLKDNLVRKIEKTGGGSIWLATVTKGLGSWKKTPSPHVEFFGNVPGNSASPASNNIYDMAEDAGGNLWISTYGGGLHYFETRTGKFRQIASSNNLIEGLQTDHHGNVWMISNGDLHRYDPRRSSHASYDLPDLQKSGGVKGTMFRDSRGRLYAAGSNYFISFHPDSIRETRREPEVHFTDFSIFNNSYSHLLQQDEIRLTHRQNYFTIEFAAPYYSAGGEVHYSYKLEGFDRDWIDAGSRNYVPYPNLEGGEYVFKVRASSAVGGWNKEFASLRIVIVPPFWKRPWFYVLCALIATALAYMAYRYRINEILKRQAIRNRIAQDLHDNVGSTLSSISVYSQVARIYHDRHNEEDLHKTLEKISDTSGEMISELNDTVWAINPRNDNMKIILQRMESFARPLLAAQNMQFQMDCDPGVASANLDMEKRKNFYLIFKEAVNNSLKYSGCTKLVMTIRQRGKDVEMKIADDGHGFDLTKTSEGYKSSDVFGGGNGLKNMQLRARQMNGRLKITSRPDEGTVIELSFPIT